MQYFFKERRPAGGTFLQITWCIQYDEFLAAEQLNKGVVCASAGNHAQGFAYSCKKLNVKGVVFMPIITPKQKVTQTKMFGEALCRNKIGG